MNPRFVTKITMIVSRYGELVAAPLLPMRGGPRHSTAGGIYVLYDCGRPVHVGRTRNLRQRLQGYCSESHYHASYAFKRARAETRKRADYKPGNSRKVLAAAPDFRPAFLRQAQAIRQMEYRFLPIVDPVEQYWLELYSAMELGTSMDEFDTH